MPIDHSRERAASRSSGTGALHDTPEGYTVNTDLSVLDPFDSRSYSAPATQLGKDVNQNQASLGGDGAKDSLLRRV